MPALASALLRSRRPNSSAAAPAARLLPAPTRRLLRASPRPSNCPAAAAPRRTRPSSQFYTEPSGSCDDAVHSPCTAYGPQLQWTVSIPACLPPRQPPRLFLHQGLTHIDDRLSARITKTLTAVKLAFRSDK